MRYLICAIFLGLVLAGCGKKETPAPEKPSAGTPPAGATETAPPAEKK